MTKTMDKEKTDKQAEITTDVPIIIEGKTRQEVKWKLAKLREKASKENLCADDGFIHYLPGKDGAADIFRSTITFRKR